MKKIMIVDDDVTSVAIVKALLEPEFEVVSANTGVEALGELQRSPDLNLILLDFESDPAGYGDAGRQRHGPAQGAEKI